MVSRYWRASGERSAQPDSVVAFVLAAFGTFGIFAMAAFAVWILLRRWSSRAYDALRDRFPQVEEIVHRAAGETWPDDVLNQASGRSRELRRAVTAPVRGDRAGYWLVFAEQQGAHALRIDLSKLRAASEWPLEPGSPTEDSRIWVQMMDRLKKKYELGRRYMPKPVLHSTPGATVGIISFGSTESAVLEAMHQLDTQHGIKADFLRIRSIPFTEEVSKFINQYDQVFVVEMNRDGQMNQILTIQCPEKATSFKSVAYGDGMPASAKWIREGILARYEVPSRTSEITPLSK